MSQLESFQCTVQFNLGEGILLQSMAVCPLYIIFTAWSQQLLNQCWHLFEDYGCVLSSMSFYNSSDFILVSFSVIVCDDDSILASGLGFKIYQAVQRNEFTDNSISVFQSSIQVILNSSLTETGNLKYLTWRHITLLITSWFLWKWFLWTINQNWSRLSVI